MHKEVGDRLPPFKGRSAEAPTKNERSRCVIGPTHGLEHDEVNQRVGHNQGDGDYRGTAGGLVGGNGNHESR